MKKVIKTIALVSISVASFWIGYELHQSNVLLRENIKKMEDKSEKIEESLVDSISREMNSTPLNPFSGEKTPPLVV